MAGAALLCFTAIEGARAQEPPSSTTPRPFYVEGTAAYSYTELTGEPVLPSAAKRPVGAALGAACGARVGLVGLGPRVSAAVYANGMRTLSLFGELQFRLAERDSYRFTFRLGAGYMWIRDVDLRALSLGRYDTRGFALTAGPALSSRLTPTTALGLGLRMDSAFVTRPALGPCDDAHGCDGVFYPDQAARGGIAFVGAELVATYDL